MNANRATVPAIADIIRQPNGVSPNSLMLSAMASLPTGGCSGLSSRLSSSSVRAGGRLWTSSKYGLVGMPRRISTRPKNARTISPHQRTGSRCCSGAGVIGAAHNAAAFAPQAASRLAPSAARTYAPIAMKKTSGSDRSITRNWRPATQAVRAGTWRSAWGETSEALFLTSGYTYEKAQQAADRFAGKEAGMTYGRTQNPTVQMLEERIAAMEGAEACRTQASGMAAMTATLLCQLSAGDHMVIAQAAFGPPRC